MRRLRRDSDYQQEDGGTGLDGPADTPVVEDSPPPSVEQAAIQELRDLIDAIQATVNGLKQPESKAGNALQEQLRKLRIMYYEVSVITRIPW